ncbi:Crp/Fnr family transcriptional regulator [uncultured Selenomonas sp.]|uniref:Crp/Fnr family transcriptional regulator n=1 Tax=uncultured Selenomonas sp. TaxID=159275 RepID=UPI0025D5D36B|nr:Crp/Fnr family transcriptional regulator [uncultured Selenomonas sp.]
MKQELFDIVKSSSLAHGMTEADVRALLASSKVQRRTLAKGGIVFHEGDVPRGLYLLLSGTLVIKKDTFSGRQIFLSDVSTPGEMFGEVYEVLGKPYDMYVEAATRAEVLEIASSLFSLAGGDLSRPALCVQRSLMRTFAQKAYYMHGRIQVLASGTLREKIVRFLADHLAADGTVQLAESRETLAAYLAVTRPSLSRELSAMAREGILEVSGRTVRVRDLDRFEAYL